MSDRSNGRDVEPGVEPSVEPSVEPILSAARRAEPGWTAGRQQQLKWSLMARLDRRRRPALALSWAVALMALLIGGGVAWRTLGRARGPAGATDATFVPDRVPDRAPDRALPTLSDGSHIVLDGSSAILKTVRESADEVVVQLEAGGAHFDVARRPSRVFQVQAGPVTVQVIGTRFHVRREGARTRISVDRGRVLASWWGGSHELGPGEQGVFPPYVAEDRALPSETPEASPAPVLAMPAAAPPAPVTLPRAERRAAVASPTLSPQALFALADRARAEGKPEAAVAHLREIVARYPKDPHAPMAAFTEGRLLLESLQRPGPAARAFGQARALATGGPLAEDALAREVEALHDAGDAAGARTQAELYRALFPRGPRLPTVMRFGGVQSTP